jgi:hypothetical protein
MVECIGEGGVPKLSVLVDPMPRLKRPRVSILNAGSTALELNVRAISQLAPVPMRGKNVRGPGVFAGCVTCPFLCGKTWWLLNVTGPWRQQLTEYVDNRCVAFFLAGLVIGLVIGTAEA